MQIVRKLDMDAWRDFVMQNPRANIFHSPEMYQAFERTKEFVPQLWAAVKDSGEVQALLLPVDITVLGGPLRSLTTRSVVYGSVLCAPTDDGQEALALLLREYNQDRGGGVLFTELRNAFDMSDLCPILEQNGFVYEEHLNFLIDLTRPSEELWKNIRSNAQRNIRKAQKSGVVIEEVQSLEDMKAAYAILQDVYQRIQVPLPDWTLFESTFAVLYPKGMMRVLLAKLNGVNIAAVTLLLYKGSILYWYSGPLKEYSEYRAGDLLIWSCLQLGQGAGCHTFDFGGGGKPDEEYGVRDFKAKFGGQLVSYGRNIAVHAPFKLKLSKIGYELLRGTLTKVHDNGNQG